MRGSGNVFAARKSICLARQARLLGRGVSGEVRAIPIGQVNGRPFLFVIGVGFDAEAVRVFESEGCPASSAKLVSFGQSCVLSLLIKIDCYASGQTADRPKPNGLS